MMRLLLPLLLAAPLAATEIKTYAVRMNLQPDGAATVAAALDLAACAPGRVNIPAGFPEMENLRIEEGPAGASLERGASNGMSLLHLTLPEGVAVSSALRFSFTVRKPYLPSEPSTGGKAAIPATSRLFRHAFVNTQEAPVGAYRFEVCFPERTLAHAIREQLPRLRKGEAGPRARLELIDGRQGAVLQVGNLKQGDNTSLQLELVPERRPLGWLIAGLVLSALYLFAFRDLVTTRNS